MPKDFLKFCLSGEILPNLVTLLVSKAAISYLV